MDAIGSSVEKGKFSIGQPVLVMDWFKQSGFAEYGVWNFSLVMHLIYFKNFQYKSADTLISLPSLDPKFLVAGINALTAVVGLETAGHIKAGEKVLITAASGGTGQIALQWAKSRSCYVIGLTSGEEKAQYLRELGADLVINYQEQSLDQVLKDNFAVSDSVKLKVKKCY